MTHILGVLNRLETVRSVLETTCGLAPRLNLSAAWALHPRPYIDPSFMPTEEVMTDQRRDAFERVADRTASEIRRMVEAWKAENSTRDIIRYEEIVGDPPRTVGLEGRRASVVVVGHPLSDDDGTTRSAFHVALYDTGACVVSTPLQLRPTIGERPVIAWRPTAALQKAIDTAWPVLENAREVTLMSATSHGHEGKPEAEALIGRLRDRGVRCTVVEFDPGPSHVGDALLQEAAVRDADLVIMGAYTHNPLIEWLRTGTTLTMLRQAGIPLFLHH